MRYACYVGRVGALAVALGVGTAVGASAWTAWGEESDSPGADSSVGSEASAGVGPSGPSDPGAVGVGSSERSGPGGSAAGGVDPQSQPDHEQPRGSESGSSDSLELGNGVVVSANGEVRDPAAGGQPEEIGGQPEEIEEEAVEPDAAEEPKTTTGSRELREQASSGSGSNASPSGESVVGAGSAPRTSVSATQIDLSGEQAESSVTVGAPGGGANAVVVTLESSETPQEPQVVKVPEPVVVDVASGVLNPFDGSAPDTPVDSPVNWVLLAAARRELGADTTQASTWAGPGAVSNSLMLATDNHAPEGGEVIITKPPNTSTGAVTGQIVGVTDADNDKLKYSGSATTAKGKVTVTSTGGFTYTPTAAARHAAAGNGADPGLKKDTFVVTVQDGKGGSTTVTVEVDILVKNALPTGRATVGKPNPSTGVVAVTVTGADTDKDLLSFSAPTTTAKGAINGNGNGNGSFTYTPTADARSAAAVTGAPASAKTDTFNVTIDDGFGGQRVVAVSVAIAPANDNVAPTGGAFAPTGQPNAGTGAITGTVSADDANGDALVYKKSTNPAKGKVAVSSVGVVTYTPTTAARHAAASDGATPADKQDTFQVTADDGRGGTTTFTVTVDISPKNTAPTGKFTVGTPDATTGLVTGKATFTELTGTLWL